MSLLLVHGLVGSTEIKSVVVSGSATSINKSAKLSRLVGSRDRSTITNESRTDASNVFWFAEDATATPKSSRCKLWVPKQFEKRVAYILHWNHEVVIALLPWPADDRRLASYTNRLQEYTNRNSIAQFNERSNYPIEPLCSKTVWAWVQHRICRRHVRCGANMVRMHVPHSVVLVSRELCNLGQHRSHDLHHFISSSRAAMIGIEQALQSPDDFTHWISLSLC